MLGPIACLQYSNLNVRAPDKKKITDSMPLGSYEVKLGQWDGIALFRETNVFYRLLLQRRMMKDLPDFPSPGQSSSYYCHHCQITYETGRL